MKDTAPVPWSRIAKRHRLVEPNVDKLASFWHADADLGREIECVNDTTKSRDLSFVDHSDSHASFLEVCARLRAQRARS